MQDNIDNRIEQWFEEEAEKLRVQPREDSWDKLNQKLAANRKHHIGWRKWLNVAAVTLVLVVAGLFSIQSGYFQQDGTTAGLSKSKLRVVEMDLEDYSAAYQKEMDKWIAVAVKLDETITLDLNPTN